MASDVGVGDVEISRLTLTVHDVTTAATVEVTEPDGTTTGPSSATTGDSGATWAGPAVVYDAPGRWLLTWDIAGTGAGREVQEVYVVASPTAGGPTWLPGRSRVANYLSSRTLVNNPASYTASGDTYEMTFDSTTRPTGIQVDRLIADGAGWVTSAVNPVHTSLYDLASTVTAIWTAAAVERGYQDDIQADQRLLRRAEQLQSLAEKMRDDLVRANTAITGSNPTDPAQANALLPLYAFPQPVNWGDDYL